MTYEIEEESNENQHYSLPTTRILSVERKEKRKGMFGDVDI
jgi:hypothetical protein